MLVWRICRERYAEDAYAGEGARLYGGRWNSKGVKMVYTSSSLALAALETFVHLEPNLQPDDLISMEAEIPEGVATESLDVDRLPFDWARLGDESLQQMGDDWIRSEKTVALEVPSAVIPGEWNVLLNPAHRAFPEIRVRRPLPFRFDSRMF